MGGARFDIQFAGELLDGANPEEVRTRVQRLFKLSDEAAERLFGGMPVTIKRGVNTATASRFREAFYEAGALVRVVTVGDESHMEPSAQEFRRDADLTQNTPPADVLAADSTELHLSPMGDPLPLETQRQVEPRYIDTSYLSLVPGMDWTLEDCEPPKLPVALPDISYLTIIVPAEKDKEAEEDK